VRLSSWNPYQASSTKRQPAVPAERTLFNLVPCDNDFEQAFADFCDYAGDVAAFAKNAGPQKLMIDYLKPDGHRAFYIPDFHVRLTDGTHLLCELKGRQDNLVPLKAQAASEWCKVASKGKVKWRYLYVPYHLFQDTAAGTMEELVRSCEPSLKTLLRELKTGQIALALGEAAVQSQEDQLFERVLQQAGIKTVASELADTMRQSVLLLDFAIRLGLPDYASAFQPLLHPLDEYAMRILEQRLAPHIPSHAAARADYFLPYLGTVSNRERVQLERNGRYLQDNLVHGRSIQRLGTFLFCLNYGVDGGWGAPGVWRDVEQVFGGPQMAKLYAELQKVNNFRNNHVAHVETRLTDQEQAWEALKCWFRCLNLMAQMFENRSSK
jgi:type III restriction enzyme